MGLRVLEHGRLGCSYWKPGGHKSHCLAQCLISGSVGGKINRPQNKRPPCLRRIKGKLCFLGTSAAAAAKSRQSCPTLCDPIDGSPTGSSVPGFSRQEYWIGMPLPSPYPPEIPINNLRASLAVQWLRLCFQYREIVFNPCLGN